MFKAMTMSHPPVDVVNPQDIISAIKRFAPHLLKEDAPSNTNETTYFERVWLRYKFLEDNFSFRL